MKIKHIRKSNVLKHTPLWKWFVIVFLVIAMPLFFSYIRNIQMQQALWSSTPEPDKNNKQMQSQREKANRSISNQ